MTEVSPSCPLTTRGATDFSLRTDRRSRARRHPEWMSAIANVCAIRDPKGSCGREHREAAGPESRCVEIPGLAGFRVGAPKSAEPTWASQMVISGKPEITGPPRNDGIGPLIRGRDLDRRSAAPHAARSRMLLLSVMRSSAVPGRAARTMRRPGRAKAACPQMIAAAIKRGLPASSPGAATCACRRRSSGSCFRSCSGSCSPSCSGCRCPSSRSGSARFP